MDTRFGGAGITGALWSTDAEEEPMQRKAMAIGGACCRILNHMRCEDSIFLIFFFLPYLDGGFVSVFVYENES